MRGKHHAFRRCFVYLFPSISRIEEFYILNDAGVSRLKWGDGNPGDHCEDGKLPILGDIGQLPVCCLAPTLAVAPPANATVSTHLVAQNEVPRLFLRVSSNGRLKRPA